MRAMVRTLGAPVMDAAGKRAPTISGKGARVAAATVLVICQTVG